MEPGGAAPPEGQEPREGERMTGPASDTPPLPATITAAALEKSQGGDALVGRVEVDRGAGRVTAIPFRISREQWLQRKHLHRAAGIEIDAPAEQLLGRRVRVVLSTWRDDGMSRLGVRRWMRPLAADRTPSGTVPPGQAR